MHRKMNFTGDAAGDISAGRPERYYNYILETYGDTLRSGSIDGLETFRDLCRQVFSLGNERSTILFMEKFVPLLPAEARWRILIEFFAERKAMAERSPEDNARRKENLLSPKKTVS